jgi:nucleotide-binding universal stress UspA family protein
MHGSPVAAEEFNQAKRKSFWNEVAHWITGKSNELLPFEEVRRRLPFEGEHYLGLRTIPLKKIIGSVGRYRDFDRAFLPTQEETRHRWQSIDQAREHGAVLPPIEVYKVGDAYFVKDGNHRVSVARSHGQEFIDAYVTEIDVPVPVTEETDIDEVIREQEHAAFLHQTKLNQIRPHVDIQLTEPGKYEKLLEHIAVHRWYLSEERGHEAPYKEAVASWVDNVYLPLVEVIRQENVLDAFPDRTETDIYLWVSQHREELAHALGRKVDPLSALGDLRERFSPRTKDRVRRLRQKVQRAVTPKELEGGPEPGQWRQERWERRGGERLFIDVLVAINGGEGGWRAQEQALRIAWREGSFLHGLHVIPEPEEQRREQVQQIRQTFKQRCREADVPGELFVETGEVGAHLAARARWNDLVVVSLEHPPGSRPLEKLGSDFRTLIQQVSRPLLAVPSRRAPSPLDRVLLAYDGSPKADEALFVAAHLAEHWKIELRVVTVSEVGAVPRALVRALRYLREREIEVTGIEEQGAVGEAILRAAETYASNLILMGSYGFNPLLEAVLGSAVDQVLRQARKPVLICR